jgi:hypothetical protein
LHGVFRDQCAVLPSARISYGDVAPALGAYPSAYPGELDELAQIEAGRFVGDMGIHGSQGNAEPAIASRAGLVQRGAGLCVGRAGIPRIAARDPRRIVVHCRRSLLRNPRTMWAGLTPLRSRDDRESKDDPKNGSRPRRNASLRAPAFPRQGPGLWSYCVASEAEAPWPRTVPEGGSGAGRRG